MTKIDKMISRLLSRPKDLKYSEVRTILLHLGFEEMSKGKTFGSRVEFIKDDKSILLHKPHPDGTLKHYQIAQIIEYLENLELI